MSSNLKKVICENPFKHVTIDANGDVNFCSPSSIFLIKRIAEKLPQIKFSMLTNGLFASKRMFEKLKITDKIRHLAVSIYTTNEKTYNKKFENCITN